MEDISVTITEQDLIDNAPSAIDEKSNWVRTVYKKLNEAGIPLNTLGIDPVVKRGFLYREDFDDRCEFLWSENAADE